MNISNIHNCFGCGVCAVTCGKNIIKIVQNKDGFYEPVINEPGKCVDCGLCVEVCSYSHNDLSLSKPLITSYAAWSNDSQVRRKCSSGGVGFEVGKTILSKGGKVCGVKYNAEKNIAEHYVASTLEELIPSIGSKYIQSYTVDGFTDIISKLRLAKKNEENPVYLITGTPCQIDSFRRYIKRFKIEDNFILLDFFCHGVPSKLMWDKYVAYMEKKVGKLTYVSWRNKFTGWHDSWAMAIDGVDKGEPVNWHEGYNLLIRERKSYLNSRLSHGDYFYRLFLSDVCLGKACYEKCRFKYDKSSADIRIGDAWGKKFKDDNDGVSAAISFTEKGDELLKSINCVLDLCKLPVVAEGQQKTLPHKSILASLIMRLLRNPSTTIEQVQGMARILQMKNKFVRRICNPLRTLRNFKEKLFI